MKYLIFILSIIFLSSCYMANGSPSERFYWLKNNHSLTYEDIKACDAKINKIFMTSDVKKSREVITGKGYIDQITKYKSDYDNYMMYVKNVRSYISQCYYEIGYRFTAPTYWCFALDSSINREICKANEKYRK